MDITKQNLFWTVQRAILFRRTEGILFSAKPQGNSEKDNTYTAKIKGLVLIKPSCVMCKAKKE